MEINKVILRSGELSLLSEQKVVVFDNLSDKKINIFFMPNTSGKSLIFNAFEHLFSSITDKDYIKNTNKDLEVEIYFTLNSLKYTYISNYYNRYKVYLDGNEIKNFEHILKKYIGIEGGKLEYYGSNRNSLHSMNRFNFLDFQGIKDIESSNEIPFVNSSYDGVSKKFILAYILGSNIDGSFFKLITELESKKEFIKKNKSKFEKYESGLNTSQLIETSLTRLFNELEENRIIYGDISVAIKELKQLRDEYKNVFGISEDDEDYIFLEGEIDNLENEREKIRHSLSGIKNEIKGAKLSESNNLMGTFNNLFKNEDLINFENYKNYKEDISKMDVLKIDTYIVENVDPYINKFKHFISGLYNIFVEKAIENNLIKEDIIKENSVNFKENTLTIEALFKTSEGMRKSIRILAFIGLHIYSKINETKCLDFSFYDSFIENIDSNYRNIIFDSLFEFIDNNKYELPKMFFFITNIENDSKDVSIYAIKNKFQENINLIESSGIS